MVEATRLLGVDMMTAHWEFTYGMDRVREIVERELAGRVEFLAQNIRTVDFEDPVFEAYKIREVNGVPVAVIGQAFPYTPIANPRYMVSDWSFGIREADMQEVVDQIAALRGGQAEPEAGDTAWRHALMTLGHDPLKPVD